MIPFECFRQDVIMIINRTFGCNQFRFIWGIRFRDDSSTFATRSAIAPTDNNVVYPIDITYAYIYSLIIDAIP